MTNATELVFILDKSGSMAGLEKDTIGGFNAMLEKQKAVPEEARITTVLFNNHYEILHDRIDIRGVAPITEKEYFVGGSTALLDAMGRTILKTDGALRHTAPEYRPGKVIFVITTDGMENASSEFDLNKLKALVERQKSGYGWEFLFLGANIDAVDVASRFGIAPGRVQNYHADSAGTKLNYAVTASAVASFRETGAVDENWGAAIREDFERRGGKKSRRQGGEEKP